VTANERIIRDRVGWLARFFRRILAPNDAVTQENPLCTRGRKEEEGGGRGSCTNGVFLRHCEMHENGLFSRVFVMTQESRPCVIGASSCVTVAGVDRVCVNP
jgi:hypothetical protein